MLPEHHVSLVVRVFIKMVLGWQNKLHPLYLRCTVDIFNLYYMDRSRYTYIYMPTRFATLYGKHDLSCPFVVSIHTYATGTQ